MQHTTKIALQVVVFLVVGILAAFAAAPQGNAPPSLQEQLEAQYQLTKMNAGTVVPGTVLVLLKEGAIGVPSSNPKNPVVNYINGTLQSPSAMVLAQFGKDTRPIPKGEKVYVTKISVNLIEDWVRLQIVGCGACSGAAPAGSYSSVVGFQFAKGSLKKASVPDVEDTIAQVFDIYTPAQAPLAPAPEPSGPVRAASGQGLTNNDILKLVAVKLPDSIIISKIQSSPCAFDTSTDEIVRLKQAGVSDAILQAMVNAGSQPMEAPTVAPEPEAPAPSAEPAPVPTTGVTDAVNGCIMAMNEGKYSEAEQYLSSSMKTSVAKRGGIKEVSDKETRNGAIDRLEILKTMHAWSGGGFLVRYKLYYKDGKSKVDFAHVIMEDGNWKIKN